MVAGGEGEADAISLTNQATWSGSRSSGMPRASRTSADPLYWRRSGPPCLTTRTPAAALTRAAKVEMLPHRAIDGQRDNAVHERVEHPAELRRGFPFGAKGDEEGRKLDRFVGVVHDLGHRPAGVVRIEVLAGQERSKRWPVSGRRRRRARAATWPQVAS